MSVANPYRGGVINHSTHIDQSDYLVQNIDFSLKSRGYRVHGILSPMAKDYEKTIQLIQVLSYKLKTIYGHNSILVDLSLSGDTSLLSLMNKDSLGRNSNGVYRGNPLSYYLFNQQINHEAHSLIDDFMMVKAIENLKNEFDLLFILPRLKNPSLVKQVEINVDGQWLFLDKKNAASLYRNIDQFNHFEVPFLGLATI